ncbi:MAG: hypothetical protein Q4F84_00880 [Fibrobacter sp.]|nr:hypothetical protein [Fibrobacter sp.]
MKIAIVIHSQSGHTAAFARVIASKFNENGHEADIKLLRPTKHVHPGIKEFELRNAPEINEYDAVLFGGPVWAFTASPVIIKYITELEKLKGKKVASFVTMGFPFPWLGGNNAIKVMNNKLDCTGADVIQGEIVSYTFRANTAKMTQAAERLYSEIIG